LKKTLFAFPLESCTLFALPLEYFALPPSKNRSFKLSSDTCFRWNLHSSQESVSQESLRPHHHCFLYRMVSRITSVSETPEEVLVHVTSHRSSSPCPQCSMPSSAIHSSYRRHPRDLPSLGRPLRLVFTVRKSFCRNPDCSRHPCSPNGFPTSLKPRLA
jgi:zinc-finger of transposase IS204/IS1001/IS1096/IS1165